MLALTKKTDYALVALAYLADRRKAEQGPVSARLIAEKYRLPLPLLMNVLKELNQANIVRSTRGALGGYELIHDPGDISLLEVTTALEGPIKLLECCDGLPILNQKCERQDDCPIQGAVQRLHNRLQAFLGDVTLDELVDSQQPCCNHVG
jgi:Rrf2 family protein